MSASGEETNRLVYDELIFENVPSSCEAHYRWNCETETGKRRGLRVICHKCGDSRWVCLMQTLVNMQDLSETSVINESGWL